MALPLKHIFEKMNGICPMPDNLQLQLLRSIERIEISKNHILLEEGQICNYYYYIEEGILSCHEQDDDSNKEHCTWLMFPGDIATSIESFNERTPSVDTIRAVKDTVLHLLSWEEVDRHTRESREFASIRQVLTNKYYLQLSKLDAKRLSTPEQIFLYLKTFYGENFDLIPGKLMASHIGISEALFYEIKKNYSRGRYKKGKL